MVHCYWMTACPQTLCRSPWSMAMVILTCDVSRSAAEVRRLSSTDRQTGTGGTFGGLTTDGRSSLLRKKYSPWCCAVHNNKPCHYSDVSKQTSHNANALSNKNYFRINPGNSSLCYAAISGFCRQAYNISYLQLPTPPVTATLQLQ